ASVPVLLRAMFWTCFQDCQYQCQQLITAVRVSRGDSVLQFHGKWPFIRLWGMQEPASVLFSLMNLIPHAVGYTVLKQHPSSHEGMKKYYKGFALVGANTWIWSAIFHTRDFVLTERLDYFSAALTMMVSFFVCAIRMFSLAGPQQKKARYALALVCSFLYLSHVSYLSLVKFSYSYNMAANVAVGLIQTLMWTIFSLREYIRTKRLSALVPLATVWSITAASSLELFDFPPWWYIVDAHSLWHLATVLPTTWWYRWMTIDL
ncbi:Per1-like protein, partial [Nadsonia fulvescens var. elongata DSM 6958]